MIRGPARPDGARDAAARAIADMADRFPDVLPLRVRTDGLDHREAALAHAIADAASRRWITLAHLIEHASGRPFDPLEPAVRAALLTGAAQLLLLDRIPPHAAINETVEWTKRHVRPRAAGLVNAVLRRVADLPATEPHRERWTGLRDEIPLHDGRALALRQPVLPDDETALVRVAASLPTALLNAWTHDAGQDAMNDRALHSLALAPVILNTEFARSADGLLPHTAPGHHLAPPGLAPRDALANTPGAWVQDPAAAESVRIARGLNPALVIDACAGLGTKTRQLRAEFPAARVLALDTDATRRAELHRLFEHDDAVTVLDDAAQLHAARDRADLLVLDVPCSNTGVLARRPEARYRFGGRQSARLAKAQHAIIDRHLPLLAPGGVVLYCTCSLQDEENEHIRDAIVHRLRGAVVAERRTEPAGVPGGDPAEYHDGGYAVLVAAPR